MPTVFSLIGTSWKFMHSQPVLWRIMIILFFLPLLVNDLIAIFFNAFIENYTFAYLIELVIFLIIVLSLLLIISYFMSWGEAAVMLVARKLVDEKAGRPSSSFKMIARQSRKYAMPILLASILLYCFTLYWSLLLIIPGIIYITRAGFYSMVIVYEDLQYRNSLRRSRELVIGHTWTVFARCLGLFSFILVPMVITTIGRDVLGVYSITSISILTVGNYLLAYMMILTIIAGCILYSHLRELPPALSTFQLHS